MVSSAVGRGRIHAASFVTTFWLRKDVSICSNCEGISTSGFAAMLILTASNMFPTHMSERRTLNIQVTCKWLKIANQHEYRSLGILLTQQCYRYVVFENTLAYTEQTVIIFSPVFTVFLVDSYWSTLFRHHIVTERYKNRKRTNLNRQKMNNKLLYAPAFFV